MEFPATTSVQGLFGMSWEDVPELAVAQSFVAQRHRREVDRILEAHSARLSKQDRAGFLSLAEDPSSLSFLQGLRSLANHFQNPSDTEFSALLHQTVLDRSAEWRAEVSDPRPWLQLEEESRRSLEALAGRGDFVPRLALFARQLPAHLTDPWGWAGFGVGSLIYKSTRLLALSHLLKGPVTRVLAPVWDPRWTASALGLVAESPAFVATTKLGRHWTGTPQDLSAKSFWQETTGMGITLGMLRFSGFGVRAALGEAGGAASLTAALSRHVLIPQAAMFGSVLLSHPIQEFFGVGRPLSGEDLWIESLFTWTQFNAMGFMGERLMPAWFKRWQQNLDGRAERLVAESRARLKSSLGLTENWEVVGGGVGVGRVGAGSSPGSVHQLIEGLRQVFMGDDQGVGKGGIFGKRVQAESFKERGGRLWEEVADDMVELFASVSLYARRVFTKGAHRWFNRSRAAEKKPDSVRPASPHVVLERVFQEHPFNYKGQIEADLHRLQEALGRVATLLGEMEQAGLRPAHLKKGKFFSPEDILLFERLCHANGLAEFLSGLAPSGRFLRDMALGILDVPGFEILIPEALALRYPTGGYDFIQVADGVSAGIAAKEVFRTKAKTADVMDDRGRARGLSPISSRRYDQRTFMDLVQEYSSSTVTRGWWTSDDIKIWHGVFIPAIVVARGGNFSVAGKTLRRYRKQLLRFSPLAYHLTPVTAWWLCRAIAGGSEPISWLKEFPQELTNPAWTAYDRSVIERWAGSKQVLGLTLAQELQTEPKGEKAALAYALVGFLRHPYAPKKAMRLALRAPEWIREDTLNLTGAMLGGFHGAAVFSPRRLATWKKTQG